MGSYKQGFSNLVFLQAGVLQPAVLISRGLTTRGSYNWRSCKLGFLQPGVLQPGVFQPVILTSEGLTIQCFYNQLCYNKVSRGCCNQGS